MTACRLSYVRGPLGVAVSLDGKPFGRISDVRQHGGWLVSVRTINPAQTPMADKFKGRTVYPTLRAAKAAIKASL